MAKGGNSDATNSLPFEHLVMLANADEADLRVDGWRGVLDRLAEIDGLQLKEVVSSAKQRLGLACTQPDDASTHTLVYHVVKKLGCRGEMERKLLIREDLPKNLIASMRAQVTDAAALALGLQALYPLAFDAPHRLHLEACGSLPLCVSSMQSHPSVLSLQQHGCKFLQLMAFDDDCKTAILAHDGLPVVLSALDAFYTDKDLAISSSDLLYFLVADVDADDAKLRGLAGRIVDAVVRIMALHETDARIQSHGVAILNSLVANDEAKPLLCDEGVMDVVEHAIGFTDDATNDSIVLLFELFQDAACQSHVVHNASATFRPSAIKAMKIKLTGLTLDMDDPDCTDRVAYIQSVLTQMDVDIDANQAVLAASEKTTVPRMATTDASAAEDAAAATRSTAPSSAKAVSMVRSPAPVAPLAKSLLRHSVNIESPSKLHSLGGPDEISILALLETKADTGDNEDDFREAVCDPKDELTSNVFNMEPPPATHVTFAPAAVQPMKHPSGPPPHNRPTKPKAATDVASSMLPPMSADDEAILGMRSELEATRGALLDASKSIEFERAKTRKVIFNYKVMKRRLAEQHKLLCVHNERSVADAEIHETLLTRVRYLEAALEEAQKEWATERTRRVDVENDLSKSVIALAETKKALEDQRPPAVRERVVPEQKYLDAQRTMQQLTGDKMVLEEAIKVAQDLLYTCETNQFFLEAELKQVRHEKMESLLMREEDIELPKPSKYFTLASPNAKRAQTYSPQPPAATELTLELNDQQAIEAFLFRAYKCLEVCSEGKGVHFSILRRYLVESGVASPPVLATDVDMILNKVLALAQENKLKEKRRKDYEFSSCPQRPAFGKLRHRYFSRNLFCEAVTLVGAKKYPYMDNTTTMLRQVILTFLNPYSTAIETKSGDVQLLVTSYDPFNFLKIMMTYLHQTCRKRISTSDDDDDPVNDHAPLMLNNSAHEQTLQAMLEMVPIIQREQKAIKVICDFYTSVPDASKDEALDVSLEALVNFAVDFEVIPAFLDRLAVKRLYKDILTYFKTFLAMYKGFPCPTDKKKYVAFYMTLGRLAVEIFKDKRDYDMPESQITGLLQWMDNSRGRGRIMRKGSVHAGIKFTNRLYAVKS
ncbi:Aste57867_13363 [Aphanomyces stellatus]|uniref:Aste57867_13363 protein n=1 Tax=Aphanomyces stellatus TaxID=120398 RepID=A0A485KY63_9STRA|nr:hypothetical protein As57867_013313 [Aphanomyces stellatus]VFT90202.1 Aste57867_13363 [Aphanomyces stellatus]